MAARYWIGGGTNSNWNASPTTNWSATSGGVVRVAAPTSADDVTFDGAGANGNTASIISATITCLSFTVTSGYTNTITHNAVLTVAGNVTLNTSYTIAGSSSMTISAASTITSGGKTWPNAITFSGSNTKTLVGDFIVTGTFTQSGTCVINKTTTETFTVGGLTLQTTSCSGTAKIIIKGGTIAASSSFPISNDIDLDGNITISAATFRVNGGTITYVSGTITTTGSTLSLVNGITLNTNGMTWSDISLTGDLTLNSLLTVSGTLSIVAGTSNVFAGSSGFTVGTLSILHVDARTVSLKEGVTYTVTSSLSAYTSRNGASLLFTSAHASTKAILTLVNPSTCNCLANFTRIDASGGRTINTFNGTITDCLNIREFHDLQTYSSGT